MKILHIGPVPPELGGTSAGGVASHLWDLAVHLQKAGHQVSILADNLPRRKPRVEQGVTLYGVPPLGLVDLPKAVLHAAKIKAIAKQLHGLRGPKALTATYLAYRRAFQAAAPEVVHIHHLETRYTLAVHIFHPFVPIVTTVHSLHSIEFLPPPQAERFRKLIHDNMRTRPALIFVSHAMQRAFAKAIQPPNGPTYVIPNPLNTVRFQLMDRADARQHLHLPQDTFVLLFVGSLIARKGVLPFLDAAALLKQRGQNFHIALIGSGEQEGEVAAMLTAHDLDDSVTRRSHVDADDLGLWYNAADLFVLPSVSESFGLVYIESLLCGTPVVGLRKTAVPEVVADGDVGVLVADADPKQLADAIQTNLTRSWDRKALVQYAHRFDWAANLKHFEDAYLAEINRVAW